MKFVSYTSRAGKVGVYQVIGTAKSKFGKGDRLHLKGGKLDFWVDAAACKEAGQPAPGRGSKYHQEGGADTKPVRGCAQCSRLGRMCKDCEFDEFD